MAALASVVLGPCKASGQLQLNQSPEDPTQGLALRGVCAVECPRAPDTDRTKGLEWQGQPHPFVNGGGGSEIELLYFYYPYLV